jgi:hypothetical protein
MDSKEGSRVDSKEQGQAYRGKEDKEGSPGLPRLECLDRWGGCKKKTRVDRNAKKNDVTSSNNIKNEARPEINNFCTTFPSITGWMTSCPQGRTRDIIPVTFLRILFIPYKGEEAASSHWKKLSLIPMGKETCPGQRRQYALRSWEKLLFFMNVPIPE